VESLAAAETDNHVLIVQLIAAEDEAHQPARLGLGNLQVVLTVYVDRQTIGTDNAVILGGVNVVPAIGTLPDCLWIPEGTEIGFVLTFSGRVARCIGTESGVAIDQATPTR
jgi:hypothetical protein